MMGGAGRVAILWVNVLTTEEVLTETLAAIATVETAAGDAVPLERDGNIT